MELQPPHARAMIRSQPHPSQLGVLEEMLQQWASATGERPAVQSWPRRIDEPASGPAPAAAAAAASSSAGAAAAASVDPPRRVLYSYPPAVPAYAHAPVRPVAQADWGAVLASRGAGFVTSAASSSSSAAAAPFPSHSHPQQQQQQQQDAAAMPFPPNMSYDLLLGHAAHLFRAAHSLDRALTMRARRDASLGATPLCFIDAFGTRLSIRMAPWCRVSEAVSQLNQSYIPAHLRAWSQIGLLPPPPLVIPPPPSAKPELMDLTAEDDDAGPAADDERKDASNALGSSVVQPHSADRVQTLSTAMLHRTLVHAQLVEPLDLAAGAASSAASASNNADCPSLCAFGNLTVLLRYAPLPSTAASTSAAATPSSSASAPPSTVRTHTLTLQVFGLDPLSLILRRVTEHARTHFDWRLGSTKLYALQRSFSLPLVHLSSVECGGSAAGATLLSDQQSLYAAGLTSPEMLLLVEVDSAAFPPASVVSLTIKTLTGRQIRVDLASCPAATTVGDLKAILARKEALPASQQRLLCEGVSLDDPARSLESYGIKSDSTLQLLLQLRSNTSGFNLSAGRPGLHPLSCDSREVALTLSQLMAWSLPPANKQRGMSSAALMSLLLHTRHLLSTIYAAVLSQVLHGHSSRGKAWIDEAALQAECDQQSKAEPEDLEPEATVADDDTEQAGDSTKKRGVSFLVCDDEEDKEESKDGSAVRTTRPRPARVAPSLIDLTAEAPAARRVFNSSSPILIDDDAEAEDRVPVAASASAPPVVVPAASTAAPAAADPSFLDAAASLSPPLSPPLFPVMDHAPLLQRRRLDSPFGPSASPWWSGEDEMPPPLELFHSSS